MMLLSKVREKRSLKKNGIAVSCLKGYLGVTENKREQQVIVSLTSHPGRIKSVHKTIITLLHQTQKPDHVILWLAEEQFPGKEKELPKSLLRLVNNGLEIKWYHDIRSYKKLIPTLKLYPNEIIITVDDDWYYRNTLVECLLNEHRKFPDEIISNAITHPVILKTGELISDSKKRDYSGTASFMNKVLGSDGVLYLSRFLHKDVFKENLFMQLAATNDDIWFWAMAVKNDTRIRVPRKPVHPYAMTDPSSQNRSSLAVENSKNNLYEYSTKGIFEVFPEIKDKLLGLVQ